VICVGNINIGGTGKTPTVIALVAALQMRGHHPAVISRGHGGQLQGPVQVDPTKHHASDVGDEPLLIAAFAPVWIAKNRAQAAQAAANSGADVIIMDDGHQNPDVAKDFNIVVLDGKRGFGNGRCFPAGPLREPISAGLSRANMVVVIGAPNRQLAQTLSTQADCPILYADLKPLETGMDWNGARVLAFAGIGHPEKFFATLRDLGAELCATVALDDHQNISSALITRLSTDAARMGAQLVTTEKDAVRLTQAQRSGILALPVRLEWEEAGHLDALLNAVMTPKR
jgi:tetraacyldisaccharide 4'-kinase